MLRCRQCVVGSCWGIVGGCQGVVWLLVCCGWLPGWCYMVIRC